MSGRLPAWTRIFRRTRDERELTDELEFHLARDAEMRNRTGASADEAQRAALRAFGGRDRIMEECRDARGSRWLEDLARDVGHGWRRLRRQPGFTLLAVATLALGIGANTALFSLVSAILLRPLPVPHAEELVALGDPGFTGQYSGTGDHNVEAPTYEQYLALRNQNRVFSGLLAAEAGEPSFRAAWNAAGQPEIVPVKMVSANYFEVLELHPALGRFFGPQEDTAAAAPEVVMSYGYWQHAFGGSTAVLGRQLPLHGRLLSVIGVAPRGFFGTTVGQNPSLYFPIALQGTVLPGQDWLHDPPSMRRFEWLNVLGRLKPGVGPRNAAADVAVIFATTIAAQAKQAPDEAARAQILTQRLPVVPAGGGATALRSQFEQPLWIVSALVGMVLLIVVFNLGALLLAQAAGRRREFALRIALGAGRSRLIRQLLTENVLLVLAGALIGLWLAKSGQQALVALVMPAGSEVPLSLSSDPRVLVFATAVSLAITAAFGLAPARQLTHARFEVGRSGAGGARTAAVLAGVQVALAVILLSGSALFIRSLQQLRDVRLGYGTQNLETFNVNLPLAGSGAPRALALDQRIAEQTARLPGVRDVTFSENGLFAGTDSDTADVVEGYAGNDAEANYDQVAPGYFAALGIPILAGREFTPQDATGPKPLIVDRAFADRYFPHADPLGKLVTLETSDGPMETRVVGLAGIAQQQALRARSIAPRVYLDIFNGRDQSTSSFASTSELQSVNFLMHTSPAAPVTIAEVNGLIARVTGMRVAANSLHSVAQSVDATLAPEILLGRLSALFGMLALALAAMGLYAMLSYAVAQRTAEIGIRMALGARPARILVLVLRGAVGPIALGSAAGIGGCLLLGHWIAGLLFGVRPSDPVSLAAAVGVLGLAGITAALLPALRASRTDPLQAIRCE